MRCHRSVTVKEIGKAPVVAVCIRNFQKENNLMTVKSIFIIADPSNKLNIKESIKNYNLLSMI